MNNLRSVFQDNSPEAPLGLSERIFNQILIEQQKQAKRQRVVWTTLAFASSITFFASAAQVTAELGTSHFATYLSLISSDMGVITTIWKELFLSLVDSLPVVSISLLTATLLIGFVAMRKLAQNSTTNTAVATA